MSRNLISRTELESAITTAIRKSDPKCESFIGVFVRRIRPKSRKEPNWSIRGVKYGSAERLSCDTALTTVVETMQRDFGIRDRD
jgi:hypothetical protein